MAAIGFDPWRNRYVVARCFYYRKSGNHYPPVYGIGHEIFTLGGGAGDGWRRTQDPPRAISPDGRPAAACTRGGGESFYWFIDEPEPCALLRFSLRDEAFDAVPSPPGCTACTYDRLADLASELCFVHRVRTSVVATHEVWMAAAVDNDDPAAAASPEWSLRYRVNVWGYAWSLDAGERWFQSFAATVAGDDGVEEEEATLVAMFYKELWWHRERSKPVVKDVNVRGSRYSCEPTPTIHHVIRYVESLVSIRAPNY
uniref:F-box associated domain-containing protein n=1 Tax=Oryza glumipatula TaxID=40148 RepID=A0A0D9ZJW8_9ORYZ